MSEFERQLDQTLSDETTHPSIPGLPGSGGLIMETPERAREPFVLYRMSTKAIDLWVPTELAVGITLHLTLGPAYGCLRLRCQVIWTKSDSTGGGCRAGLRIVNQVLVN